MCWHQSPVVVGSLLELATLSFGLTPTMVLCSWHGMRMSSEEVSREVREKRILHWNCRGMARLPPELLKDGREVREIYLKWNALVTLPSDISRLKRLTNLYLYANMLVSLPDEIGQLVDLQTLDVSQNMLTALPDSIGRLEALENLVAPGNKLAALPKEIPRSLKVLNLSGNCVRSLPDLSDCTAIEEIHMDQNELRTLPNMLVYLPNLRTLSVCHNRLMYLPSVPFVSHPTVYFDGNPMVTYLPYTFGCQQCVNTCPWLEDDTWGLSVYGCFETCARDPNCVRITTSIGDMTFPPGVQFLTPTDAVPSLLELALRAAYSVAYKHRCQPQSGQQLHLILTERSPQVSVGGELPKPLCRTIDCGPMALCFGGCNTAIFSQCVLWVIARRIRAIGSLGAAMYIPTAMYFCSQKCAAAYEQEVMNSEANWEQMMVRSRLPWFSGF